MIPKTESLVAALDEMEADVACITETWLNDSHGNECRDFCDKTDYNIISKNRRGRRGGGVCIVYNKSHITMKECRLPESEFEVVAAIGRLSLIHI